jgi:hypothetical protein
VTGFRGCFKPGGTSNTCIPTSSIGNLESDASNIISKIGLMNGNGGSGTNVCGGLDMANTILTTSPNAHTASNTIREIIILSDGDNNYDSIAYASGSPGSPVVACRPSTSGCPVSPSSQCDPANSDAFPNCGAAQPRERQLDNMTKALADQINRRIEIASSRSAFAARRTPYRRRRPTPSRRLLRQYREHERRQRRDQRLLKCIAHRPPARTTTTTARTRHRSAGDLLADAQMRSGSWRSSSLESSRR